MSVGGMNSLVIHRSVTARGGVKYQSVKAGRLHDGTRLPCLRIRGSSVVTRVRLWLVVSNTR